jgi:valyl-tRNA synthetase
LQETVERIRNLRSDIGLAPRAPLTITVPGNLGGEVAGLLALLTAADIEWVAPVAGDVHDALAAVEARAPKGVLMERYRKDAARLRSEVERGEKKLGNAQFTAKAAAEVVAKEREKLEAYRSELQRVEAALAAMGETA